MTMVEGASFFKVDTVVSLLIWIWMLYFFGLSVVIYRLCVSDGCHGVFRAAEATYALHIHAEVRVLVDTCSIVRREIRQLLRQLLLRNIPNEVFESFATFSHCSSAQQCIKQESPRSVSVSQRLRTMSGCVVGWFCSKQVRPEALLNRWVPSFQASSLVKGRCQTAFFRVYTCDLGITRKTT